MSIRRKARETALQCLYQQEFTGVSACQALKPFCTNFEINKKAIPYAQQLLDGITENLSAIDALINKYASNWRISRMAAIDRNVIRIAVYEFCFTKDVPATVAINEAIDIAKRFSTDDAGPFVNGILDAIRNKEKMDKS